MNHMGDIGTPGVYGMPGAPSMPIRKCNHKRKKCMSCKDEAGEYSLCLQCCGCSARSVGLRSAPSRGRHNSSGGLTAGQALESVLHTLGMDTISVMSRLPMARETLPVSEADKSSLEACDAVFEDIVAELARVLYPVDFEGYGARVKEILLLGKLPVREVLNRSRGDSVESQLLRGMICEGLGREDSEKILGPRTYDEGKNSWEAFLTQDLPQSNGQGLVDYGTDIKRMMVAAKKAKNKLANASVMFKVLQKAYPYRDDIPSEGEIERIMANYKNFNNLNEVVDSLVPKQEGVRRNSIGVRYQGEIENIGNAGDWMNKPRDVLNQLKKKYEDGTGGLPPDFPTDQQIKNRFNSQKTKRPKIPMMGNVPPSMPGPMPISSVMDIPGSGRDYNMRASVGNMNPVHHMPDISGSVVRGGAHDLGQGQSLRKNSIMPVYQQDILEIAAQNNWQHKAREVVTILKRKYEGPSGFPADFPTDEQIKNRFNSQKTKRPKM